MNTISSTLAALSLVSLFAAGCVANADSGDAAHPDAKGYGYEFAPDAVSAAPPAASRAAQPSAGGRVAPELIQGVMRAAFPQLDACAKQGHGAAQITLRFTIATDGHVTQIAEQGAGSPDRELAACVVGAAKGLAFPASDAGVVTVVYPLTFAR